MFYGGDMFGEFIFLLTSGVRELKLLWFKEMPCLVAHFLKMQVGFPVFSLRLIDSSFFCICFPFVSGCEKKIFEKL